MKLEKTIVLTSALFLFFIGLLSGFKTRYTSLCEAHAFETTSLQTHILSLQNQIAQLESKLEPLPFSPPLEELLVSSATGYRTDPMGGGEGRLHKGVDLVGPIGLPVRAVLPGTIVEHWLPPGVHWGKQFYGHPIFGATIVIDHGDGLYSLYGHLSATMVHEGMKISQGQVIGLLGDTGISTGPHLHFEIIVDPLRYLAERVVGKELSGEGIANHGAHKIGEVPPQRDLAHEPAHEPYGLVRAYKETP